MGLNSRDEKEQVDTIIETYLPYYEGYLDHIVKDYWVQLSDSVRNKNVTEFKLRIRASDTPEFMVDLAKRYQIISIAWPTFDKGVIMEHKRSIEAWEITLLTIFEKRNSETDEIKIKRVILLKKKDTFWNMRQRVKKFIDWLLADGELNPRGI